VAAGSETRSTRRSSAGHPQGVGAVVHHAPRRSDRAAIRKPVVFVEGFPGGYE
jgi:hypothetical protein